MSDSSKWDLVRFPTDMTPAEMRDLAQAAMNDADLFDALTAASVVKEALRTVAVQPRRGFRVNRMYAAWGALAAALLLIAIYTVDRPVPPPNRPQAQSSGSRQPQTPLKATLDLSDGAQPILLAACTFRRHGPSWRRYGKSSAPSGWVVVSIEEGLATFDLGSIDGVVKGAQVQVLRASRTVGSLTVTTVFRERSKGQLPAGGPIEVGDQVRVSAPSYFAALIDQVDANTTRGDFIGARQAAERALNWSESAAVQAGDRRRVLQRLAALEMQAGALGSAGEHYQAAAKQFDAQPRASEEERSSTLNALGVLYLLRGDHQQASVALNEAASHSPSAVTQNNLGAAAEMRGDRAKAASFYAEALRALAGTTLRYRRTVETNLARVRSTP